MHVYIFYLESIAWTSGTARKTFGTTLLLVVALSMVVASIGLLV